MKFISAFPDNKSRRFEIKEDANAGFYLYVYEGGRCIRDYLQDTLELAKEVAFEEWEVPTESWRRAEDLGS